MSAIPCPQCGRSVPQAEEQAVRFCPFCGASLAQAARQGPSALELAVAAERKPAKKYALIQAALAAAPDDFAANRALLYHGRLHETLGRGHALDFSIIKCHLLSIFDTPEQYDAAMLQAKYEELLRAPQLRRTMALAPDADGFFAEYIHTLAYQYIDLFIRGDSRVSTVGFGFGRSAASMARRAAPSVRRMLRAIHETDRLTETERALLTRAVREGYERVFPGQGEALEAEA